jgi:hypothetical protein
MTPPLTLTPELLTGAKRFPRRGGRTVPLVPRLSKFIAKGCAQACWPWVGHLDSTGFPKIVIGGHQRSPRRLVWALANDHEVPTRNVETSCGSRLCLNPRHLRLRRVGRAPNKKWKEI